MAKAQRRYFEIKDENVKNNFIELYRDLFSPWKERSGSYTDNYKEMRENGCFICNDGLLICNLTSEDLNNIISAGCFKKEKYYRRGIYKYVYQN